MKIKYIIHWFFVPRDRSGNVYSYVAITDTRSGRTLLTHDVPESNATAIAFHLNGEEHKQNYYFAKSQITWQEFKRLINSGTVPYVSSSPEDLATAFKKVLRSRKKVKA